jgi:hypothetical protein
MTPGLRFRSSGRAAALALGLALLGGEGQAVLAQQPPATPKPKATPKRAQSTDRRCQLVIERVDRQGVRTEPSPNAENLFAGGNVRVRCRGQNIHIASDSLASYGGTVVQFIGSVRYRDSSTALDADFGTYFKDGEHFDAQGNVNHKDLKSGSTIVGPRVDYFRQLPKVRPEMEIKAYSRPTIHFVVHDSLDRPTEPYVVVGNTVKLVGSDLMYAGGNVTIDRSDLKGRSDSLWLDSGRLERGQMLTNAELHGAGRDTFNLTGKDIDLALKKRELTGLKAKTKAKATSKDVNLDADSIQITLANREVETIRAWGKQVRPKALSGDHLVYGDSLVIETPGQQLKSVKAYGSAWAGFRPDSSADTTNAAAAAARRDWISGETVVAQFVERDSAGVKTSAIKQLQADEKAKSYYQMAPEKPNTKGSINYTRADHITVTMRVTSDSNTVERVDARGNVDGIHLQPSSPKRDSTRADSVRTDSLKRAGKAPPPPSKNAKPAPKKPATGEARR